MKAPNPFRKRRPCASLRIRNTTQPLKIKPPDIAIMGRRVFSIACEVLQWNCCFHNPVAIVLGFVFLRQTLKTRTISNTVGSHVGSVDQSVRARFSIVPIALISNV